MRIYVFLLPLILVFYTIGIDNTQAFTPAGVLKAKAPESDFFYVDPDDEDVKTKVGTAKAVVYISNYFIGELQSTAGSRVFMSTADAGYDNLSFQGRGTIIGTADKNQTAPPGRQYYQPPRNKVFETHDKVAYAGATEHTVVCSTVLYKPRQVRNLEISYSTNAYLAIGNWDSPSEHIDDLDPSARAHAEELNPGQHFEPPGGTSVDTDNHDWVITNEVPDLGGSFESPTPNPTPSPTPVLSYSLVSSDGVYTTEAGTVHEANFTTNQAYSSVSWYVKSPSDTSYYGTNVETDYGDGSTTTAQLSYSFPSGVSGDYVITAYVYDNDSSVYETSYTVSVSLPSSSTPPPTTTSTPSPGLSAADGSTNPVVRPGGTHEAELVTSEPYYYVYWYVKAPGDTSSLGTLMETDEGWQSGGTETEASFSYTFPDNAAGVYTITAVSQRYSNLSEGSTRSYTVTVE